jgi:pSer/pThr/pTyr-binding forkhead associated (FHA) protein
MPLKKEYYLMVMSGPDDGRIFEINKDQVTIGRGPENEVVLRNDPFIRSTHVLLVKREGQFFLITESLADKNSSITVPVNIGQIFTLGETEFAIKVK